MKIKAFKGSLALIVTLILIFTAVSCTPTAVDPDPTPTPAPAETPEPTDEPVEVLPDLPADRYDARVTPRTGNNATNPLVVSTGTLDVKFSPFFATSAYDTDVVGMTQIGLLHYNKDGGTGSGN